MITNNMCMHAKSLQSCATLCDPVDCSPPGSSVHGILQARILERGCALLQGIIPIQGLNPCLLNLLHWQVGSLPLALPGPPKILSYLFKIKWSGMLVNVYVSRVYVKWHTFLGPIVLTSAVVNVIWPWPFKEYHFYVLYSCEIIWGKWESLG